MNFYTDIPITNVGRNMPQVASGDGIDAIESHALRRLWTVWSAKYQGNALKLAYYNSHNRCKNLQLAFASDQVATAVAPTVGWPAKAVDMLAERSQLDYFALPDDVDVPELRAAYDDNDMAQLYRQATTSELVQSCSAMTVTLGDETLGDPPVVVNAYSALNCAMMWDRRHKRIAYGMTVTNTDDDGNPTGVNLFMPDETLVLALRSGRWVSQRLEHSMGRPLMEPLVYKPSLDRPLGKSRISRAVRSITDNAVREVMRTEVSAEVFTAPQRYFLNVDASKLDAQNFKTYWNGYFAITGDGDGNTPSAGQFNPPGMNDHISYMRSLAAQFSGETGLPISSLGVVSDNPSSAEAIYAAKEDLINDANYLNVCNGSHMMNVARLIVATARNVSFSEATKLLTGAFPYFKRTDMPSQSVIADMALKEVKAIPDLAKTKTFLRQLFPDDAQFTLLWSELGRASASDLVSKLIANSPQVTYPNQSQGANGNEPDAGSAV